MAFPRTEATTATAKILFALSGNRCAFADPITGVACENELARRDWHRVRAEMCHIRGERPSAARYDANQTDAQRRHFDNLILMCHNHHYEIDSLRPGDFTVDDLIAMKRRAEQPSERLPAEFSDSRINAIAIILSDDYHNTYGSATTGEGNLPQEIPGVVAKFSAGTISRPVVTLAAQETPIETTAMQGRSALDAGKDHVVDEPLQGVRNIFFRSVDTPEQALAFIRDVVEVAGTPFPDPLDQEPTVLEPLIPDIRRTLLQFPDLVVELRKSSASQWVEIAERWAAQH